ncbi:MAG: Alpha/beta hydrolase fold-3 domain protein [Phycisphaerales bacterium]|nr:Alpha/beta hydrolase fold-3 domain protein [Phycisphaerales bacterium]
MRFPSLINLSRSKTFASAIVLFAIQNAFAETPATRPATPPAITPDSKNVCYRPNASSDAERQKCTLDIYTPPGGKASAAIVWFHGGNITGGDKSEAAKIANPLLDAGISLISANYRLSPAVKYPAYVEDAAAAVAWVMDHADQVGTTADHVFVGGYSAGGFLACAVGTQPQWLATHGHKLADLRGIVGVSPQVFTHYTIRAERGIKDPTITPVIDDAAPVFYAAADLPPIQLFVGDHDMDTRREELEYFMAILKAKKNTTSTLTLTPNRTHGTMTNHAAEPGDPLGVGLVKFIQSHANAAPATQPAKSAATQPAN